MFRTNFRQNHFLLYELELPYCTYCTPVGELTEAWHTPVTCEESSDDTYSLWFCGSAAPAFISQPSQSISRRSELNSKIFRCVVNGSESTAKLKAGQGLASRGTMTLKCDDFDGDPGPINFSDDGTFFGKLLARNILDGKKITTYYCTIVNNGNPEIVSTSTHFITNTQLTGGVFTITAKDALKDIEAFSEQFPEPSEVSLTADIDTTTTTIPVDSTTGFVSGSVFRIDDELFYVNSVSGSNLIVAARGTSIVNGDGTTVYKTNVSSHTSDSTVQQCYVMNKRFLSNVLSDIFTAVGLSAYIDFTQWDDEITEWNANAFLYGVFSEPEKVSSIIDRLLSAYIIDMWLDQPSQLVKVNAVSSWKQSIRTIEEGNDLSDLKISTSDNTRFSRAYVYNKKDFKAENDDVTNYSKLTLFTDTATEDGDFYGSIKVKEFDPNDFISTASAQILCSRWIQRYAQTPKEITFTMEERKLADTGLGDIVDIITRDSQTPSGQFLQARDRAQILRIQPVLNNIGRQYKVTAQSYIPLIASDPNQELVITLTGSLFDVNLYARAGAPNVDVNVTFVFDGATIGSTANNIPAITAGSFASGTRIRIFCINGTTWSAKGGDGGDAYAESNRTNSGVGTQITTSTPGENGGDCYRSNGIETEIYLNYTAHGYTANSTLYAAGGGSGGGSAVAYVYSKYTGEGPNYANAEISIAVAGSAGSGIPSGKSGSATAIIDSPPSRNPNFDERYVVAVNPSDATFSSAPSGSSRSAYFQYLSSSYAFVSSSVTSGAGGASVNAGTTIALSDDLNSGGVSASRRSAGSSGAAGGAFKGSNITVYNLSASSGKLRDGNSDSYTLITS